MNKNLHFGTDGIRGKANQYPFTRKDLIHLGMAIAKWSIIKYKNKHPKVLLGYDTRISSPRIKEDLKQGLSTFPIYIIDGGLLPTPAVCKLIQNKKNQAYKNFNFGIVISASHNPYDDNGIKLFDAKNSKLKIEDEKIIIKNFKETEELTNIKQHPKSKVEFWGAAKESYKNNILSFFKNNFLSGIKIVLDCANGATYKIAPEIFTLLGAKVITIFSKPNGKNINHNCGALNPEQLKNSIIENKADIGFGFDGDGDRLILISRSGKITNGDDILTLLSEHNKFKKLKTIVSTIMSNLGFEEYLKNQNKFLIRTAVGDKHVASKLIEQKLLLGGENSGHIIMKDYMNSGDGIFAALRTLETIIQTNNWDIKTFIKVPQICINISVSTKKDLSCLPFSKIIKKQKDILKNGRIIIRYSGTENLLRIMTEDKNKVLANNVAKTLSFELANALNTMQPLISNKIVNKQKNL